VETEDERRERRGLQLTEEEEEVEEEGGLEKAEDRSNQTPKFFIPCHADKNLVVSDSACITWLLSTFLFSLA